MGSTDILSEGTSITGSFYRSLIKKYQPSRKKDGEDETQFTYAQAFVLALDELGCIANQHETVADAFKGDLQTAVQTKVRELRDTRKMVSVTPCRLMD
jgi:hypothetical protein